MSNITSLPDGFKQNSEGKGRTSSPKAACNQQSHPQVALTNGSTSELDFHVDGITRNPKYTEKVTSLNHAVVEKEEATSPGDLQMGSLLPSVFIQMDAEEVPLRKEGGFSRNSPDQSNKEKAECMLPPTSDVPTILILQKKKNQESPEPQNKTANKIPAKKSNVTVITLKKKTTPKRYEIEPLEFQQSESDKKHQTSSPVLKHLPALPSKQQNQEEVVQVKDQFLCTKEDSNQSSSVWSNKEAPPPPLTLESESRLSKVTSKTRSRKEKPDNKNDFLTESSTGKPVCVGQENNDFENNDKSTYPSTNLECEENPNKILRPNTVLEKAETKLDGEEQDFTETNRVLGPTDTPENSQNLSRPSALHISVSETQSQHQTNMKTEAKSLFKFKFPKNKLAALSQAFQTGTNKIGKKASEVAIEKEEKIVSDFRPVMETKKPTKEPKSSELHCNKGVSVNTRLSKSNAQVEALCKDTFKSINSLEESIKQLEISMDAITAPAYPPSITLSLSDKHESSVDAAVGAQPKGKQKTERSPSKRSSVQMSRGQNPPQSKRVKPQSPEHSGRTTSRKKVWCCVKMLASVVWGRCGFSTLIF